jgi:hypothetical protein
MLPPHSRQVIAGLALVTIQQNDLLFSAIAELLIDF